MDEPAPKEKKTVLEALFEVVDQADNIEDILIIYAKKGGKYGSGDNDLSVSDALFLLETYKHFMLSQIVPKADG